MEGIASVIGFSLLTRPKAPYNSFFWVSLKDSP
jgi:hypothetical protein